LAKPELHRAVALITAHPEVFLRQGAVAAKWRRTSTGKSGPYYVLRFRIAGHERAIYLGREGPAVEEVRRRLAMLHERTRSARAYEQWRREAMGVIRGQKDRVRSGLAAIGLGMKGFEIRGWRKLGGM
jgi:hypothetical protein